MKNSIVRLFECSNVRHSAVLWLSLSIVYCLLSIFPCNAQSPIIKYAREIIDTLAAPGMHGRGYVNKGDSIAADFLKKEFEKIGVKPIGKEFYQRFSFSINTHSDVKSMYINGRLIFPGKNILIHASSPAADWPFTISHVKWLDSTTVSNEKRFRKFKRGNDVHKWIAISDKTKSQKEWIDFFQNNKKIRGLIFLKSDKLTWSMSQSVNTIPTIELLLDSNIKNDIKASKGKMDVDIRFTNKFIPSYESQNILCYIKGTQYPDSFIVFSAHYDHLGRMGKDVYFPGANDNASGCAMLLTLAKYYAKQALPLEGGGGGGLKYSVAFMAFGAEEVGLLGSKHYVENPLFPLKQIKFLINMDIMGTGDEGIKVVNATEHKKEFDILLKINEEKKLLPSIQPRGKAKNSDHYFFEEAGVKTFFIYTLGGIKAYHDIYDRAETLPLTKFEETSKLLTEFSEYLQK